MVIIKKQTNIKKKLSTESEKTEKNNIKMPRMRMFGGAISVACDPCTFQESASQSVCLAPKGTPASLGRIAELRRPDVWVFARRC